MIYDIYIYIYIYIYRLEQQSGELLQMDNADHSLNVTLLEKLLY